MLGLALTRLSAVWCRTLRVPHGEAADPPGKPYPYGGQAVIEGVMMKGRKHAAVALRRKNGEIQVVEREMRSRFPQWLTRAYFLRGFFLLWDMLGLGMWALNRSQDAYLEDAGEKTDAKGANVMFVLTAIVGVVLALSIFKLLPTSLVDAVNAYIVPVAGTGLRNTLEGILKFGIFVGYVAAIGLMPDIRRVFMYHGAEHAVINAYEENPARRDLDFVARHTRLHPRCGTSFIAILIVVSVVIYYLFDRWLLELGVPAAGQWPIWWVRWPLRILLIPLLAGFSYEVLKGAFALRKTVVILPLIYFGMLFQILTTRHPTRDQLEVAQASLAAVRAREESAAPS
jgi:uncharacterized protein YqhQ